MKNKVLYWGLVFLNILLISIFIIQLTSSTYPTVGNDYRLFGPRLLDSLLFYKVNGFGIEWYTPSFGGGLPAYPNPLQMQFSFQQLFTFAVNPWIAILLSCVVYIALGFVFTYLLLRDILDLGPFSAILGANFFVASGFLIERMIVGHADKITFPLIVIPIYAILNRRIPAWLNGVFIALTGFIMLNSGGVYIIVMFLFMTLVALPLLYILKPGLFAWKKMLAVTGWGFVLAVLLCGSKLYPITQYLVNFPRVVSDHYFVSLSSSIAGAVLQLIGVMPTLPFLKLVGKNALVLPVRLTQLTGTPYGFWEIDSSISPVLILLLVYGLWTSLRHKPVFKKKEWLGKGIAAGCLIFSVILVFQFAEARGFLFEHLRILPVFKSLRTNTRFISAYVLPLSVLGAMAFDHWIRSRAARPAVIGYAVLNVVSLVSLTSYYLLPLKVQYRGFDITSVTDTYNGIQAGQTYPVKQIIPDMNDYEVFKAGATNVTHHYDPLLSENSFKPHVHEGSVFEVTNGFFNMSDPTGYIFPTENGSRLFSLIPVSESRQFQDFINRRQPDWKLPFLQIILDWAAGLTFIAIFLAIIVYLFNRRRPVSKKGPLLPFSRRKSP